MYTPTVGGVSVFSGSVITYNGTQWIPASGGTSGSYLPLTGGTVGSLTVSGNLTVSGTTILSGTALNIYSSTIGGVSTTSGQVMTYNGVQWVSAAGGGGGGSTNNAFAVVNLSGQTGAITSTNLFTAASGGLYQINYYGKVTTAASTASTLGPFNITSTDPDGSVITIVGETTSNNTVTSGVISDTVQVYVASGTNVTYTNGYSSTGATGMQYNLHVTAVGTIVNNTTLVNVVTSGAVATTGNSTISGIVTGGTFTGQIINNTTLSGTTLTQSNGSFVTFDESFMVIMGAWL